MNDNNNYFPFESIQSPTTQRDNSFADKDNGNTTKRFNRG